MNRICALVILVTATVLLHPGGALAQETFGKTANPSSGSAPLTVVYTYTFDNSQGHHALSVDKPSDDKCSSVIFSGGDSNHNNLLDIGEIWTWTCTAVINTTTTNTSQTGASYTVCQGNICTTTVLDFITEKATVTITPAPLKVSITGTQSACKGDLVTLTAVATGGTPPYTFKWNTGATSQTITPSTAVAGTFSFGVTVTDQAGRTAFVNTTLTVASVCLVPFHATAHPQFPLLTTIEWGCGFQFAGRCLSQTIVKICIGGQCLNNPAVPGPPLCKVCDGLIAAGAGFALGLGIGLFYRRMRRRSPSSGSGVPSPSP